MNATTGTKIGLSRSFLESLSSLSRRDQKRVRDAIELLTASGITRGTRLHPVGRFLSLSVSMSLRVIAVRSGDALILLHTATHDAAYLWAEKTMLCTAPDGNFLAVLPIDEREGISRENPIANNNSQLVQQSDLVTAGMPIEVAKVIASISDQDRLLKIIETLSPVYQQVVLSALSGSGGNSLPENLGRVSDIFFVPSDGDLEAGFCLPEDHWRVYLHPRQRFAVEFPLDGRLLIRGGPGTGKTVILLHRFLKNWHSTKRSTGRFITLTTASRAVVLDGLIKLGITGVSIDAIDTIELTADAINNLLDSADFVCVDEGQDLPAHYIAALLSRLERAGRVPAHTIAYDINQSLIARSGAALQTLADYFDTVHLSYCYRNTREIAGAAMSVVTYNHTQMRGTRGRVRKQLASMHDSETVSLVTPVIGPGVVKKFCDGYQVVRLSLMAAIRELCDIYEPGTSIGIVCIEAQDLENVRQDAESAALGTGIKVLVMTPVEAKGREFFCGIVIDTNRYIRAEYSNTDFYQRLSGIYCAVSRFRDRLYCFYRSPRSPLSHLSTGL